MQVLAILLMCSIEVGSGDTFSLIFWCFCIVLIILLFWL